jgi:hypothetical protein
MIAPCTGQPYRRPMGLVDEILKHLVEEAAAISRAPLAFIACLLVPATIIWIVLNWRYAAVAAHKNERIASLEERVKLRDDQLNNKVRSISADEARKLIEALQARVADLAPRTLTKEQRATIVQGLHPPHEAEWSIRLTWDGLTPDAETLAEEFQSVFRGWRVIATRNIGSSGKGMALKASLDDPAGLVLSKALQKAGVAFTLETRPGPLHFHIGGRERSED